MKKLNPTHQIFMRELFKSREATANNSIAQIYKKQYELTGYAGFFYKGHVYTTNKQKTNKLHKSLYQQMNDYLVLLDLLYKDKEIVSKYLNLHKDKPIYYLIPVSAYSYIHNHFNLQGVTPTIQAPPEMLQIINLNQLEELL